MATEINRDRLTLLETMPLLHGKHDAPETDAAPALCALEAAAWVAGEPWSDSPACVCPVVAAFCRSWNDGLPDDETRTRLLRPLVPLMVGTRSTPDVVHRRGWLVVDWEMRTRLPAFLRLLPTTTPHAGRLAALAPIESLEALQNATSIAKQAGGLAAAARDAARDAARAAAGNAAWAATRAAAWAAAGNAAWAAARAAARTAAGDAARDVAWTAARDVAWAAARARLSATVAECQQSAVELVRRLCAEREVYTASSRDVD